MLLKKRIRRIALCLISLPLFVIAMGVGPFQAAITRHENQTTALHASQPTVGESVHEGHLHVNPSLELGRIATNLLLELNDIIQIVWNELSWLAIPFVIVLMIKRFLLKESVTEIVACGMDLAAHLLLHAIGLIRYIALHLRKLAKQLKEKVKEA